MVYLSTSYRDADSIETVLRDIGENSDIRHVELSGGTSHRPDLLSTLKQCKRTYGFTYLLHNYFPPPEEPFVLNIADGDEENRRRSIEFAKRSIRWCAELGIPHYTVHAGYPETLTVDDSGGGFTPDSSSTPPASTDEARWRLESAIDELLDVATEHGIRFGVENLFPAPRLNARPLLCEPDEITSLLETFADEPAFGLLLDIGHLNVSADWLDFDVESTIDSLFRDGKEQLLELHVSYNLGDSDDHDLVPRDSWMTRWLLDADVHSFPVTYEPRGYSLAEVCGNLEQLTHE